MDTEENVNVDGKKAMKGLEDEGEKKKQKDAGYEDVSLQI